MKSNLKLLTCPSFAKCQQVKLACFLILKKLATPHQEEFEDATSNVRYWLLRLLASINQLYLNTVNGSASWFSDMPCDNYKL